MPDVWVDFLYYCPMFFGSQLHLYDSGPSLQPMLPGILCFRWLVVGYLADNFQSQGFILWAVYDHYSYLAGRKWSLSKKMYILVLLALCPALLVWFMPGLNRGQGTAGIILLGMPCTTSKLMLRLLLQRQGFY